MASHLQREIEQLKKNDPRPRRAGRGEPATGVRGRDQRRRRTGGAVVVDGDVAIDLAEVDVEEDCLKLLALYQPVAGDLRFIVAVVKINTTLERVGDLGVNVAEHAASMAAATPTIRPSILPA